MGGPSGPKGLATTVVAEAAPTKDRSNNVIKPALACDICGCERAIYLVK